MARRLFFVILGMLLACGKPAAVFYVAADGDDAAPGTLDRPLQTLAAAQIRARQAARQNQRVTVCLRKGRYPLGQTLSFGPEDSGSPDRPVTYRAFENESVHLVGGRRIESFAVITDETVLQRLGPEALGRVLQTDLRELGINDFGALSARGFGRAIQPSALELFCDDQPMTLARWPNAGWALIADTLAGARQQAFFYQDPRPGAWTKNRDVWLHGYWTWDWADSYEHVASIDARRHLIVMDPPGGVYGYHPEKRFYALNVLEELDQPGEYYVDRESGMLYFWPPTPVAASRIDVSLLAQPLLHLQQTRHIRFEHLIFEAGRGMGVVIQGGSDNLLLDCTVRNMGTVGVCIGAPDPLIGSKIYDNTLYDAQGGVRNGVRNCRIYQCGEGGVILTGGDRITLTPGENFVENCHIYDCCRWVRTYRAGIFMWGVGNQVRHNHIHDLPHTAVFFWGNDHLLEYNEISRVCLETGDAGAFYLGRDWSQRGSVIRYNYFHDLRGVTVRTGFVDVMAIYLDDLASGTTIYGNVFDRAGRTIMIGGGRDNLVENNLVMNGNPGLHIDARGSGWAKFWFDGRDSTIYKRLLAVKPQTPPYADRYPALKRVLQEEPALPRGNRIVHNIFVGDKWLELLDGVDDRLVHFEMNKVLTDSSRVRLQKDRLVLDPALLREIQFKSIPFENIGLKGNI